MLLQGLGVNTIGIPKERWYPSYNADALFPSPPTGDLVVKTPRMQITEITWDALWGQAQDMFGDDAMGTGQIVAALSASQTFVGLGNL